MAFVGDGDLLDGPAANRLVAGSHDFDTAAPEEDGVAGIVRDVVHRDDMVEGLAHRDKRGAVERHIPRLVHEEGFARSASERAVLACAFSIEHDDHGAKPLGRKLGVFGFLRQNECGAVTFLHCACVDAYGSVEVGVEAAVAVAAVAVLHGISGNIDFTGIDAWDSRLAVVGHHVVHAVEAHAAIRAIVVFKDDLLRSAAKDCPMAGNGRELVAGDVARRAVEHEDLER